MGLLVVGVAMYERFANDDESGAVVGMLILVLEVIIGPPLEISVLGTNESQRKFDIVGQENYRSWLASNVLQVLLLNAIRYSMVFLWFIYQNG